MFHYTFLHVDNGKKDAIDMSSKWSSTILAELLDTAGSGAWQRWKAERTAQGLPILEDYGRVPNPPDLLASLRTTLPKPRKGSQKADSGASTQELVTKDIEKDIERARSGSGAAAILPQ